MALVADWRFGIQEENMQAMVDQARGKGAQVVVVLSHNGMDVDLKMASRVRGIDAIFGGHTHDGVPLAIPVANGGSTAGGKTLVTNAGGRVTPHRFNTPRLMGVAGNPGLAG